MEKTQKARVLRYLERYHKIDPIKAWNSCGCYRLSSVIHDLRKDGIVIVTMDKTVKNKYGEKCIVAEYVYER